MGPTLSWSMEIAPVGYESKERRPVFRRRSSNCTRVRRRVTGRDVLRATILVVANIGAVAVSLLLSSGDALLDGLAIGRGIILGTILGVAIASQVGAQRAPTVIGRPAPFDPKKVNVDR